MRSAKLPEYIQVRSGVFYVRMAVLLDLRELVGKAELKRSLNTRSRIEAAQLAPPVVAHFHRQIQQARSQCTPVHTTISEVPIEDARQFVRKRLSNMQTLPDQSRARGRQFLSGQGGGERSRRLNNNRELLTFFQDIENGDQWSHWRDALGRSTVHAYEQEHHVRVAPQSIAHGVLSDFGAQAQIEHLRRAIHRDENPYVTTPAPDCGSALAGNDAGQTLGQLLKSYRSDKEQTWKASSADAFCKVERLLCGWFGAERSIQSISRNDFRELFHALPRIPSGYTRFKAFQGMPVRQVIEAADALPEPLLRLTSKSCSDYVIQVNSLLNWASKEEWLPKNPATGLSAPRTARTGETRKPFTSTQLQQLFTSGCYALDQMNRAQDGAYWLPLIALFTGMRSGEIARLRVEDIEPVDDIICFRLTDAEALKTKTSVRDIPVHSELRRLGFLEFVERGRQAGEVQLFYDIRRNGKNDQSSEFSKTFRKMLTRAGLNERSLGMHSFRHTFTHGLVDNSAPQPIADALLGWGKQARNMYQHYGGRPPIRQLLEATETISHPNLNLQHLYPCSTPPPTASPRRQFD